VQALVAEAESAFGPVDIFCANAGIIVVGGPEASDEDWDRIWSINVKAHIYAARALLPSMLERGEGYIVTTASAAGLLTQLGSAPYSVTKHAAVAFAEWLSITYGDRGVRVSCLCPQGVWTGMTGAPAGGDSAVPGAPPRPDGPAGPPGKGTALSDGILSAETVADSVIQAIGEEQFLILPHPEVATYEQRRAGDRERWLRGMRRAQAQSARFGRRS
jgi:NAD(P)-dependent dehydrogenase (short-subunit alcohol dehydrogenase family)